MSNNNDNDPTRWSQSTGELEEKQRAEAGQDRSGHSSYSEPAVEEALVGVRGKATNLSMTLNAALEARARREKGPQDPATELETTTEENTTVQEQGEDTAAATNTSDGMKTPDTVAFGVRGGKGSSVSQDDSAGDIKGSDEDEAKK